MEGADIRAQTKHSVEFGRTVAVSGMEESLLSTVPRALSTVPRARKNELMMCACDFILSFGILFLCRAKRRASRQLSPTVVV